jgi:DeoR family transcriptional regulator of aga operon
VKELKEADTSLGMPAPLRREHIRQLIGEREFVRVADLSEFFGVSEVTIRGDLDLLASRSLVRRVRGGAMPSVAPAERPFEVTQVEAAEEKEAIAAVAVGLLKSGETVILDVGTTTAAIGRALVERTDLTNVTVFTNSLSVALILEPAIPRLEVVVTGGTLRPLQHSLVNPLGTWALQGIKADTVFLGCSGVDPEGGVSNVNLPEAEVKRVMLQAAHRRVVVADGSKIGRVALTHLCDIDQVDMLITGRSAPTEVLAALRERGLDVRIA